MWRRVTVSSKGVLNRWGLVRDIWIPYPPVTSPVLSCFVCVFVLLCFHSVQVAPIALVTTHQPTTLPSRYPVVPSAVYLSLFVSSRGAAFLSFGELLLGVFGCAGCEGCGNLRDPLVDNCFVLYCNSLLFDNPFLLTLFLLSSQGGGEAPCVLGKTPWAYITRRVTSLSKHTRLDLGGPPPCILVRAFCSSAS